MRERSPGNLHVLTNMAAFFSSNEEQLLPLFDIWTDGCRKEWNVGRFSKNRMTHARNYRRMPPVKSINMYGPAGERKTEDVRISSRVDVFCIGSSIVVET